MLTVNDIRKLMEVFTTKQDLEQLVHRDEFDERFNTALNRLDSVYKELVDVRMDLSTHMHSHREIEEDLDKIKSIPVIAHELKKLK